MSRRAGVFTPFLLCLMVLVYLLPAAALAQDQELLRHPRNMFFPPLAFHLPKAERTLLSNGMVLYLFQDAEIPLIRISALIRTGSMYDPPSKAA